MPDATCPECDTTFYISLAAAENKIPCKTCGHVFRIIGPTEEAEEEKEERPRFEGDASKYPVLSVSSVLLRVAGALVAFAGVSTGIADLAGPARTFCILIGLVSGASLWVWGETIVWMIDVEAHLRKIKRKL